MTPSDRREDRHRKRRAREGGRCTPHSGGDRRHRTIADCVPAKVGFCIRPEIHSQSPETVEAGQSGFGVVRGDRFIAPVVMQISATTCLHDRHAALSLLWPRFRGGFLAGAPTDPATRASAVAIAW